MKFELIELICTIAIAIITIVGGCIALITYRANVKQTKINNTFTMLEFARTQISKKHIEEYIKHKNANESYGKYFVFEDGKKFKVEDLLTTGFMTNEIYDIIKTFNLICMKLLNNDLDEDIIWFEYGDMMLYCNHWTETIFNSHAGIVTCQEDILFFCFNLYMDKNARKMLSKPFKYYEA